LCARRSPLTSTAFTHCGGRPWDSISTFGSPTAPSRSPLSLASTWKQVCVQHGPFPEKSGDYVAVRAFRKKCLGKLMKIKHAWPQLNAAVSEGGPFSTPHWRRSPPVESRTPTPECAPYAYTALPRFSPGDCSASSLSHSLPGPILRLGLWLPPAACLALEPLGRRKPAARTLTLAQRGVCHCLAHATLARPCTWLRFVLPAIGFGRCRQSWVSGKRSQTLNA
jgi:hypothetical protein